MANHFFIKVPPHIARDLGIEGQPGKKLPDGNYMAFITHMTKYCKMYEIERLAPSMGCAVLKPWQMKEEFLGKRVTPLPVPTDPRFIAPAGPQPEPYLPVEFDEELGEFVSTEEAEDETPEEEGVEDGND